MTINGQNFWCLYTCTLLSANTLLLLGVTAIKIEDLKCDFETDSCGWTMENLERDQYESPLYPNSGPKSAQNGDFFVFMNIDQNTPNNHTGFLIGKPIDPAASNACLRFWYHMLGEGMGSLSVYANSDTEVTWKKSGNQENVWHCAAVRFVNPVEMLSIETTKGSTLYSIIALDNIEVFVNIPCDQEDCESIGTKSATEKSTSQDIGTTPSNELTTKELHALTTVSTTDNLEDYLPYIAGIPAGVLVVSVVVVCVCLKRRKKKLTDEELFELRRRGTRHQSRPYNAFPESQVNGVISTEEVYDTLDERKMVDGIQDTEGDYNTIGNSISDGDYYLTPKVDDYEEPNGMIQASPGHHSQVPSVSAIVADSDYEKPVTKNTDNEDYLSPVFAQ